MPRMKFEENVPLAPLTTLHTGGPSRFFTEAKSVEEVWSALDRARTERLSVAILGGGSNMLVADKGFDGLVLAIRIPGIAFEISGNQARITVGAGMAWDEVVVWAIENGFAGFECLSGVPGTVGGGVVANLGCYGAQLSDTFVSAEVFDTEHLEQGIQILKKENCNFSYHNSVFGEMPGRYVVLRATFTLVVGGPVRVAYADNRFNLSALAEKNGYTPTLEAVRDEILSVREQKGQLHMPDRICYQSAGSFFHMPFVSESAYQKVLAQAHQLDGEKELRLRPWAWVQPDGSYKLAPGFLLEYTEFQKGYQRGLVGISPRHILTIINLGGAQAKDIAELAGDMCASVQNIFGIRLEREVEYIGNV